MARPVKVKALQYLQRALDQIPRLRRLGYRASEFQQWKASTMHHITRIFENKPEYVNKFDRSLIIHRDESEDTNLDRAGSLLKSMIEEVEDDWTDTEQRLVLSDFNSDAQCIKKKVFVIHGHDGAARETVVRFLEKLNLEPEILHEQPNEGRTIIEKFEDYADVKFAVVLLTPDDVGAVGEQNPELRPRARQNVVFEFGYFIGKLGREGVCALAKGDIEKPSDSDGVRYVPLDDEDWVENAALA